MRDLGIDSTDLDVRDTAQNFIDSVLIESVQDVTRRGYSPERKGNEPVIRQDKPWENTIYFTWSNYARHPGPNYSPFMVKSKLLSLTVGADVGLPALWGLPGLCVPLFLVCRLARSLARASRRQRASCTLSSAQAVRSTERARRIA